MEKAASFLTGQWQSRWWGTFIGLCYMGCSLLTIMANKVVLTTCGFNYPNIMMATQMVVLILGMLLLRMIDPVNLNAKLQYESKHVIFFSVFFAVQSVLSLTALEGMNLPLFGAVKRCTALMNLLLSVIVLKKGFPPIVRTIGVLLITGGCIMAVLGDVKFEWIAYTYGLFSVITKSLYLTIGEMLARLGFNSLDVLYTSVVLSLPMFLCMGYLNRELTAETLLYITKKDNHFFFMAYVAAIVLGALVTILALKSTAINSALTTSLFSSMKTTIQAICGYFLFKDVKLTVLLVTGVSVNILGGFLYGCAKPDKSDYEQSDDNDTDQESDEELEKTVIK